MYHTLCGIRDDLEAILDEPEHDPIYNGISPRKLYGLEKKYGYDPCKVPGILEWGERSRQSKDG